MSLGNRPMRLSGSSGSGRARAIKDTVLGQRAGLYTAEDPYREIADRSSGVKMVAMENAHVVSRRRRRDGRRHETRRECCDILKADGTS